MRDFFKIVFSLFIMLTTVNARAGVQDLLDIIGWHHIEPPRKYSQEYYPYNPCTELNPEEFPSLAFQIFDDLHAAGLDQKIESKLENFRHFITTIKWSAQCNTMIAPPIIDGDKNPWSSPREGASHDFRDNSSNFQNFRKRVREDELFPLLLTHEAACLYGLGDQPYAFVIMLRLLLESKTSESLRPYQNLLVSEISRLLDERQKIIISGPRLLRGGTSIGTGGDLDEMKTKLSFQKLWLYAWPLRMSEPKFIDLRRFSAEEFRTMFLRFVYHRFEHCTTYNSIGTYVSKPCQSEPLIIRETEDGELTMVTDISEDGLYAGSELKTIQDLIYYAQLRLRKTLFGPENLSLFRDVNIKDIYDQEDRDQIKYGK